jgi:hypothetical protein
MNDINKIVAKGHKIDPEEFAAAAKELRKFEDQANTACRDKLEQQLSGYTLGYKDGLKVGIAQGRYEMGKVQWRRLFFNDVAGSIVGSSIGFFIGFLIAYWFINL